MGFDKKTLSNHLFYPLLNFVNGQYSLTCQHTVSILSSASPVDSDLAFPLQPLTTAPHHSTLCTLITSLSPHLCTQLPQCMSYYCYFNTGHPISVSSQPQIPQVCSVAVSQHFLHRYNISGLMNASYTFLLHF